MSETIERAAPRRLCGNCWHFDAEGPFCRRHAPRPRFSADLDRDRAILLVAKESGDDDNVVYWPRVDPDEDWCGEWSAITD
jgi:hypothetical protein